MSCIIAFLHWLVQSVQYTVLFTMFTSKFFLIVPCICLALVSYTRQDKMFEIFPSKKIIIDDEDSVAITCRYNEDCNASWYQEGYYEKLEPCLHKRRPDLGNNTKELTCKYQNFKKDHEGMYECRLKNCAHSPEIRRLELKIEVKAASVPNVLLLDNPGNVTANSNASFILNLTGSPMPHVSCLLNGKQVILCSSEDMKKVMYDNPSHPCKSADLQYQFRSKRLQTSLVVFNVINVTFAKYNGMIYCNWQNDAEKKNFSMRIMVTEMSPTNTPASMKSDTNVQTNNESATIIGIVIGCVLLLLIGVVIGMTLFCRERKLKNKYKMFLQSSGLIDHSKSLNEQMHELSYDKDWEFPVNLLEISKTFLGGGNFGIVYKGQAYGIGRLDPRNKSGQARNRRTELWMRANKRNTLNHVQTTSLTDVALKTVKGSASLDEIRDFIGELKLMMHIGEHKHIVNLLGVCYKESKLHGILEYCPHGDLRKFLHSKRSLYELTWVKTNHNEDTGLTLADQVTIANDVADGMQFLVSQKCIHRDLAARNILLAQNYVVKIADFGIARNVDQDYIYTMNQHMLLPYKWMALESLVENVFTKNSDVWSFGILLWEIMTLGGVPYPNMTFDEIKPFLSASKRLEKPEHCTDDIYAIMLECWQEIPNYRPSFGDINEFLRNLLIMKISGDSDLQDESIM